MSSMMKALGIDKLTTDQRVDLALEIWESLGKLPTKFDTDEALMEEIQRRDAEMRANPEIALTRDQLRQKLEQRYGPLRQ